MIQADCLVSITKDHQVVIKSVTPIEALLLTAEHHKQVGGNPVQVIGESGPTSTIERTSHKTVVKRKVKGKDEEGNEHEIEVETPTVVFEEKVISQDRTEDQEGSRLRAKYGDKKVDAMFAKYRNLPKTFEEALGKGINLTLPTGGMISQTGSMPEPVTA